MCERLTYTFNNNTYELFTFRQDSDGKFGGKPA